VALLPLDPLQLGDERRDGRGEREQARCPRHA
jgi:hypothetical protein